MKNNTFITSLEARPVSLRVNVDSFGKAIDVDEAAGILRNVAIMCIGPAKGHGWSIDRTTLEQVAAAINAKPNGVKCRFGHPADPNTEMLGTQIAHVLPGVRIEGDTLRGDVQFGDYASNVPGRGDVRTYLLNLAKCRPSDFGLSAVIHIDLEPLTDQSGNPTGLVARVSQVDAVDFVSEGAATPNGLLSAQHHQPATEVAQLKENPMDPKIKANLISMYGLKPDATDEQAQAFYDALTTEDQAEVSGAELAAEPDAPTEPAKMSAKQTRTQVAIDPGDEIVALTRKRVTQITMLAQSFGTVKIPQNIIDEQIGVGASAVEAQTAFLKYIQESNKPVAGSVRVGEDRNVASLKAAIPEAIMLRADARVKNPSERAVQLRHMTLIDMGRQYLMALGAGPGVYELSRSKVAQLMLSRKAVAETFPQVAMFAQSTSDFSSILADTIGKSLRQAYLDAPATWTNWSRRATAPDFKTISRASISESPGLVARKEGGEVKYVTLGDSKETYTLTEYVGGIKLTRQAVINDDLDAFSRVPTLQAAAAKRKEDDVTYAVLTANAALADTGLLFNSTAVTTAGGHANLAASNAVISVASLAVARAAMRKQLGPKGEAVLNLMPKYLIVPAALESVAEQYTSSQFVAATSAAINPFATGGRSALTVIVEPRLDANSSTAWYLAADNNQIDTVETCFLLDEPEPVLKQETEFDTDDQKFAVRHTVAAKAIDFRGLFKNIGA